MIPEWRARNFVITFFLKGLQPHAEIVSDLTFCRVYLGNFLSFNTIFFLKDKLKYHVSKFRNLDLLFRRDHILKEK